MHVCVAEVLVGTVIGAQQYSLIERRMISKLSCRNSSSFLPAALVLGLQPGLPVTIPVTVVAEDDVTSQRYYVVGMAPRHTLLVLTCCVPGQFLLLHEQCQHGMVKVCAVQTAGPCQRAFCPQEDLFLPA